MATRRKARAKKPSKGRKRPSPAAGKSEVLAHGSELIIITGMSGSGKASVLKSFEDLGYYCVDNLPIELVKNFAELSRSAEFERTALVIDVREGQQLHRLPQIVTELRKHLQVRIVFLDCSDETLVRRFSESRRPHPLGRDMAVPQAISAERERLNAIRQLADFVIDTSKLTVHDLRARALDTFRRSHSDTAISVGFVSFGFKHGIPQDCDLLFDVRFLPNPHFIPALRPFTGKDPKVAKYVMSFPQTLEFIGRISELLIYLLPHYVREGKSYLTIGFGCTGGQHRSVLISEQIALRVRAAGYDVHITHRDARDVPKD